MHDQVLDVDLQLVLPPQVIIVQDISVLVGKVALLEFLDELEKLLLLGEVALVTGWMAHHVHVPTFSRRVWPQMPGTVLVLSSNTSPRPQ